LRFRFALVCTMPRALLHKKWSVDDDELLKRLWSKALPLSSIARRMRRSAETVRLKAHALRLPPKVSANTHSERGAA
jgi:hypothetical protein